jgi:hypothetical protein
MYRTGCTASPGSVEENVRNDVSELKEAVRTGIQIMGYVLEGETGMLREVRYVMFPLGLESLVMLLSCHGVSVY